MNDDSSYIDSNAMYHKLMEVGNAWADRKAAYTLLDATTKSVLADLTKKSIVDEGRTRVSAEMVALASTAYREHLDSVAEAHRWFLKAQVRYDSLKTLVELRRSEESTRRTEMQL